MGDGDQGLRLLRGSRFDVVLCDVFMPGQGGLEILAALRQEFPTLPVAIMSGAGFGQRVDVLGVAGLLGARAILDKPFTLETLREALQKAVGDTPTVVIPTNPPE